MGKDFYATGWSIGFIIGTLDLIQRVVRAHTRICFVSVSPLQEAAAIGYEQATKLGFLEQSISMTQAKMKNFNQIWDELGLPVSYRSTYELNRPISDPEASILYHKEVILSLSISPR